MRNIFSKFAQKFTILSILIIGGIGVQTIISCSGGGDDGGSSSSALGSGKSSSSSKEAVSSSSNAVSSSASEIKNYCVYPEILQCYFGPYSVCPGLGGTLADSCPYSSSSEMPSSSSIVPSSSSAVPIVPSSSSVAASSSSVLLSSSSVVSSSSSLPAYAYCVFLAEKICLLGPMTICPPGGALSNSCPYGSSSSVIPSSSSAAASSSSVVVSSSSSKASSSSVIPSSSSVVASSSSSGSKPSSSSSAPSSSSVPSQSGVIYGPSVTYEGEIYETVVIGSQTWFKRNLNYAVIGSMCVGSWNGSSLSEANTATCDTNGRVYDWATAMALSYICNFHICASQVSEKHRGICPSGWHISSNADWNVLIKFVEPSCSANSYCNGAGTKLKATSGWFHNTGRTDNYGFSALPGGYGTSDGKSNEVAIGIWWTSSESSDPKYSSKYSYYRSMDDGNEYVLFGNYSKEDLLRVRCVQD
ncbi:hypothetical protein R83H12_02001 [Fibrobacteria bacterium R8-3-H12]